MRKMIWVCDRCGFEKHTDNELTNPDGWCSVNKYTLNDCESIDLCPECAEEIFNC